MRSQDVVAINYFREIQRASELLACGESVGTVTGTGRDRPGSARERARATKCGVAKRGEQGSVWP